MGGDAVDIARSQAESTPPEGVYEYRRDELVEPDWRRFPGWREVSQAQWSDPQWQRAHCVKDAKGLRAVVGDLLDEEFYADWEQDRLYRATMSVLLPPQMINTIAPHVTGSRPGEVTKAFYDDPVRRYMLPVFSDRHPEWPSHPMASRDSLHEQDMWVVEGLTHRYPTKVLAELLSTCPQYCGHCTRMDLVGNSTPQVTKNKLTLKPVDRAERILGHLRRSPGIRDVVVSGGDLANLPWPRLESFLASLLEIESIRDIRLASKALIGLPQYWASAPVLEGITRIADTARARGVQVALHTHANAAQQVTPAVADAARALLAAGLRDVRNQGVLMRGVNDTAHELLDLCFALTDHAGVTPYYFYMCDMIPNAEHWRVPLHRAQLLQRQIMGYLPGFATPRIVCDVPFAGKRWVDQTDAYDRDLGISHWSKSYLTPLEAADPDAHGGSYHYYDPIDTLPASGQRWWRETRQG
ncbi:lysine 2,3-aminomutase [Streptomyces xanthophaeus]|uniref:Lysine 2,3-aminomutase n=1 Tax=Streptomyces xanthophaeus TaxID=67385 RepID=A0A919GZ51_9ACTN|nr:lysine 2,3-aminomutase [Streptomyces xanthophaeus]